MYKNYLNDYILRSSINHPLTACKLESIILNTTNNNLIANNKQIVNILLDLINVSGQYPKLKKAKKNVSAFSIRTNMTIGTQINLHNKKLNIFFKNFIFSILPNLKNWQNIKLQKINKKFFIYNFGFENISYWFGFKPLSNTGLHVQFIIKHLAKNKDFLYYLSKYNLKT